MTDIVLRSRNQNWTRPGKPEDLAGGIGSSQKIECGAAIKAAFVPLLRRALSSFSLHVTIDGNGKGRRKAGL